MTFLSDYQFAADLDRHFVNTNQGELLTDDYYNVIETFFITGSEKNKRICLDLFKRLPKDEVIRRSSIVVRLSNILTTIHHNHMKPNDISSTRTTST